MSSVGAPGPFISLISMLELEPRLARVRVRVRVRGEVRVKG